MPIVGGLDIHRKQLTFDYLDTVTGEVRRGQIAPADRAHLRAWLARFAGRDDVAFAVEGCTGGRYVAEELAGAGVAAHLAEPADTAGARGRKRRAKTGKSDSRHLRQLLAEGRVPECWIPPERILECRALLETYHDLRRERTEWAQRIHAVFFHQGAPQLGEGALRTERGLAALREASVAHLSPAGQLQVAIALDMITALEIRLGMLRHQLLDTARHRPGAKVLAARLYGIGPVTALAMTCWLGGAGRFTSSRQAVRFAGLDITIHSSDGKGPPGRLSRQAPPVLCWTLYEARKVHSHLAAPGRPSGQRGGAEASPAARSSRLARSANAAAPIASSMPCAVRSRVTAAALPAQPLPVQQMGARARGSSGRRRYGTVRPGRCRSVLALASRRHVRGEE
jgi:transposase